MATKLTIGEVSRQAGIPARTIRFYEDKGVVPAPPRTETGYRLYSPTDVRRLRLARRARSLGLGLPEVKVLVREAFAADCTKFGERLLAFIDRQRADIDRRLAELAALLAELDTLEDRVRHSQCPYQPGLLVVECGFSCPLIDEATPE
jgi:DNA-binding transcriptional MerR regulator